MRTIKFISRIVIKLFIATFFVQLAFRAFYKEEFVITGLCVLTLVVIVLLKPSDK